MTSAFSPFPIDVNAIPPDPIQVIVRFHGRWEFVHRWWRSLEVQRLRPGGVVITAPSSLAATLEHVIRACSSPSENFPWSVVPVEDTASSGQALLHGLKQSAPGSVAFLDDPDEWYPCYLENAASLLSAPTAIVFFPWSVRQEIWQPHGGFTQAATDPFRAAHPVQPTMRQVTGPEGVPLSATVMGPTCRDSFAALLPDWGPMALAKLCSDQPYHVSFPAGTPQTTIHRRPGLTGLYGDNAQGDLTSEVALCCQRLKLTGSSLDPGGAALLQAWLMSLPPAPPARLERFKPLPPLAALPFTAGHVALHEHTAVPVKKDLLSKIRNALSRTAKTRGSKKNEKKKTKPATKYKGSLGFKRNRRIVPKGEGAAPAQLKLGAGKVLTLDVFDTALARRTHLPTDVFVLWESELAHEGAIPAAGLAQDRIAAEVIARRSSHAATGSDECTLQEIYATLAEWRGWSPDQMCKAQERELAWETTMLYPVQDVLELAREAERQGIPVHFISDMYLPASYIAERLVAAGYPVASVTVSGEARASKARGGLFEHASRKHGWALEQQIHLGDNVTSDLRRPTALGIAAVRYNLPAKSIPWCDEIQWTSKRPDDICTRLTLGLVRESMLRHGRQQVYSNKREQQAWNVGYQIAGPLIFGYVHWLRQRAASNGQRKLFFLSRDGWMLHQGFERLRERWPGGPESVYIHGSRQLFDAAGYSGLNHGLPFRLKFVPEGTTITQALLKCGINWEEAASAAQRHGFLTPDHPVVKPGQSRIDRDTSNQLAGLLLEIEPLLAGRSAAARRNLLEYYHDAGFDPADCAVVDLGWNGSLLHGMAHAWRQPGHPPPRLSAYYLGSWQDAAALAQRGIHLESWFVHHADPCPSQTLDAPDQRAAVLLECIPILELCVSSLEGSVVALDRVDGRIVPRLAEPEFTGSEAAMLKTLHLGAMEFVRDLTGLLPAFPEHCALDDYLEGTLRRFLSLPGTQDAAIFSSIRFYEDLTGTGRAKSICHVPVSTEENPVTEKDLLAAYRACYWRKGFRAQLPQEMNLRWGHRVDL